MACEGDYSPWGCRLNNKAIRKTCQGDTVNFLELLDVLSYVIFAIIVIGAVIGLYWMSNEERLKKKPLGVLFVSLFAAAAVLKTIEFFIQ